ncbi:hypothetical protein BS412_15750 [Cronobacter turicensis]|uniref:Uncharacterized protein n=2 Tax=Cronobacter turicensis TaxID=413502 RepID=A0A2T7B4Q1_9ENTR|nr:hypothetical protein [Cronobacter turicensis]PUX22011.1 hypothetical protein BS411_10795 [Cronobacter turicensis]PUX32368.1 hypothetical protein BS412_15750 [Cronobacter turicensis]
MSAPLHGAGYARPPKRAGTKEEVLARIKAHLQETLGRQYETERKEARMTRQADALADRQLWDDNLATSFMPGFVTTGPRRPEETDYRMRQFLGRYGHVRSD